MDATSSTTPNQRPTSLVVLAGCLVAGSAVWASLVVGRVGDEQVPVLLWILLPAIAIAASWVSRVSPTATAAATFGGPVLASGWTAPRGDGDGLWVLWAFFLAAAAVASAVLARMLQRRLLPGSGPRFSITGKQAVLALPVFVVAGCVVVWLMLERRPDPYPRLEELVERMSSPDGFSPERVRRTGDPLCSGSCAASVEATYTTTQPAADVCASSVRSWLDQSSLLDLVELDPIVNPSAGYQEVCAWSFAIDGAGGVATVSDSSDGTSLSLEITTDVARD